MKRSTDENMFTSAEYNIFLCSVLGTDLRVMRIPAQSLRHFAMQQGANDNIYTQNR
jgi:hypothetical protein